MKTLNDFAHRVRAINDQSRRCIVGGAEDHDDDDDDNDERGGDSNSTTSAASAAASTCPSSSSVHVPVVLRLESGNAMRDPRSRSEERVQFDKFLGSHRFLTSRHGPFWNAARNCPFPSHNDLFGGMYMVEDKDPETESHFHNLLVCALRDGGLYGLCENRTAFSAMYFDLDFKGPKSTTPSTQDLITIVGLMRDVFLKVGGPLWVKSASAIIATSPEQVSVETGLVKFGAHIIFPYIVLSMDSMIRLNLACRDMIESYWPDKRLPPSNSWTDVFDTSMYRTGLRMLFVDKNQKCPHCNRSTASSHRSTTGFAQATSNRRHQPPSHSPPTHVCTNGFVGQKRPYRIVAYVSPHHDVNDEGMFRKLVGDPVLALHMASIRKPSAFREMPTAPVFDASMPTLVEASLSFQSHHREAVEMGSVVDVTIRENSSFFRSSDTASTCSSGGGGGGGLRLGTSSPNSSSSYAPADSGTASSTLSRAFSGIPLAGQRIFLDTGDRRLAILQRLIRAYDPERFGELVVKSSTMNSQGSMYTVHVSGPGRHACMNCPLSAPHSRSIVYFTIDVKNGVVQKCTSKSEKIEQRTSKKTCRSFKAPSRRVAREDAAALFSNLKTVSSMNLVIDNGNVYIPDMMLVEDDDGSEAAAGGTGCEDDGFDGRSQSAFSVSFKSAASCSSHHGPGSSSTSHRIAIRPHMTDPLLSPDKSNISSSCLEVSGATALRPLVEKKAADTRTPAVTFCTSSSSHAMSLIPSTWRVGGGGGGGGSGGGGGGGGSGGGGGAVTSRKRTATNEFSSEAHRQRTVGE